jgi:MFS family permease
MKQYRFINNITGWLVFAVAAFTYLMTIEPTASLWDCGEFIASSYKLEIGHPPGSQVFMIIARVFTLFAGGNEARVAAMVNGMSALASAFTILFLFWTITHLARKILIKDESQINVSRIVAIMGAGIVGSLAYTFSDSFWFSAVEGEVYATSSLFTAAVFWAILKWEDNADVKYADKWIILIAFLMGLSIGVHLLNLLALPAIVLVYYFKKFEFSWKGLLVSIVLSFTILALLIWGIIPGIVKISSRIDLFFVNTLKLPSNSGMVVHFIILAVLFVVAIRLSLNSENKIKNAVAAIAALFLTGIWVVADSGFINILVLAAVSAFLWYTAGKSRVLLNTILTAVMVILIGYSSTAIIVIRASANPPLNENNPSDPFSLLYYLNREQYGDRPLFYGPYYNAPVLDYADGKPVYVLEDNKKYIITHRELERVYDDRFLTLFPRMWSDQGDDHADIYKAWGGSKGIPLQVTNQSGEKSVVKKPKFSENLKFMFTYQFGYMYFRYFMWNFSGRQNDTQGTGGAINGNWITGIKFLDEPRTGTYDLPDDLRKDPSRNTYYMLPFLLGLIGMFFQLNTDNRNWFNVMLLFVMTGLAIVFYLNQYPNQPRERDYAYAGSFYFYAVWIGLGVLALFRGISLITGEKIAAPAAGIACFLAVPLIMGSQNWDDHDRSGRYLARDVAFNYLESCVPNSILFTNGDNDTFPLWYAQEVEGKRTDIRVCNLMLLNTDWYIEQMKHKVYESDPLPISLPIKKYYDGINNQVFIVEKTKDPVDVKTVIDWVASENPATKVKISANEILDIIPTRTIRIPVDAVKVIESGVVRPEDSAKIVPYIEIKLKGNSILKSQLIVLDILAHNDWKRPIYFVTGYHNDAFGLEEYFQLEGLAYRLVPVRSENKSWVDYGRIDTDILYENIMQKFVWGGANDRNVYIDYNHNRTLTVVRSRLQYAKLAKALVAEGKKDKALEVLDRCLDVLPPENVKYDPYFPDLIEAYFVAGNNEKAVKLTNDYCAYNYAHLDYYLRQSQYIISSAEYEIQSAIQYTSKVSTACMSYGEKELAEGIDNKLETYYRDYLKTRIPEDQLQVE